jgi:hypothetical protein
LAIKRIWKRCQFDFRYPRWKRKFRIACQKRGLDNFFTGFEIDKDYYEAQEKRFKDFVSQLRMF